MTSFVARVAHSLMTRLAILLLTLAGLIAAVLTISWLAFHSIETRMASLSAEHMPDLRRNQVVATATDQTRSLLTSAITAQTPDELQAVTTEANQLFSAFRNAIEQLSTDAVDTMRPALDQSEAAVSRLLKARSNELEETARLVSTIETASKQAEVASALIEEANDSAFFDMTLSGEETTVVIEDTLTRLVDENFTQFQTALAIRGEVNLIAGLAIAYSQDDTSQISSIIADLARGALGRLTTSLEENRDTAAFASILPVLSEAQATFSAVFDTTAPAPDISDLLATRLAVDTALSPALDDIYFELIIANDEAKETNRTSLSQLLEVDVEGMRVNASLDTATRHFFAVLLQVASARSGAELELRQRELETLATDLLRLKEGSAFEADATLLDLLQLAASDTGVASQRGAMLDAQAVARAATQDATRSVDAIARETSNFS